MVGFEWDEKEAREYLWREAVKEGEMKGEKRGERRGKKEGIKEGIYAMIKNMLSCGFSISDIMRVSGYSEKEVLAIKNGASL